MPSFYEYLNYQVEDFVVDHAFQQWVHRPDNTSNKFWEQFLNTSPHKREQVEEASEIVRNIHYRSHSLSKAHQDRILQKVYHRTEKPAKRNLIALRPMARKYLAVAASMSRIIAAYVQRLYVAGPALRLIR